jgi:hypothetical protein
MKLLDLVHFYELNKIIYNKFKHGMLFTPGLSLNAKLEGIPQSVFMAFDLLARKPEILCFQRKDVSPPGLDWFNTYSMLVYGEKSVGKCLEIVDELVTLSEYILWNHLLWALNCGQDYLPASLTPEGVFKINMILNKPLTEKETETVLKIFDKISPNMHVINLNINLNFNFSPEKFEILRNCLLKNQVATITKL